VAEDFSEGAGKIVAVVEARRKSRFGAVGFAGTQQPRGVVEPMAQQDLMEGITRGAFEDAVELVGAGSAGAGGFGKGEFGAGTRGLVADQRLGALGDERVPPGCVAEMFAKPLGALGTKGRALAAWIKLRSTAPSFSMGSPRKSSAA